MTRLGLSIHAGHSMAAIAAAQSRRRRADGDDPAGGGRGRGPAQSRHGLGALRGLPDRSAAGGCVDFGVVSEGQSARGGCSGDHVRVVGHRKIAGRLRFFQSGCRLRLLEIARQADATAAEHRNAAVVEQRQTAGGDGHAALCDRSPAGRQEAGASRIEDRLCRRRCARSVLPRPARQIPGCRRTALQPGVAKSR